MDPIAEIRRLYFRATARTIERDLMRAVALAKTLNDADRLRVAVYLDGLSQMRSEWAAQRRRRRTRPKPARPGRRD